MPALRLWPSPARSPARVAHCRLCRNFGGPDTDRWSSSSGTYANIRSCAGNRRRRTETTRAASRAWDEPVIRRFDAPEALDMRFHEIRTKSALNRVPGASRLPFAWTVNPYRGCSHACTLLCVGRHADPARERRTRTIADLRVGRPHLRHRASGPLPPLVETHVLAQWSTVKAAYRVTLADGTELVASGDHRFLSRRGWKHVTDRLPRRRRAAPHAQRSAHRNRPFRERPGEDADYRRGYLCGMVRGDAHLASLDYPRRTAPSTPYHEFRLALADSEALDAHISTSPTRPRACASSSSAASPGLSRDAGNPRRPRRHCRVVSER